MTEIKDFNGDKIVKVNCDFCDKKMECPEERLKTTKKHMCFECFNNQNYPNEEMKNVHVDIPLQEMNEKVCSEMADKLMDSLFPGIWQEKKEDLREKSKKDLAG